METNNIAETNVVKNLTMDEKLKYFFTNPNKIFEDYNTKPTWLLKLLIILALSGIGAFLTIMLTSGAQMDLIMQQTPDLTREQAEMAARISTIVVAVAMPITAIASVFLTPLIYYGLISLFGGKTKYMKLVAVYTLAYIPAYIGSLVSLGFAYYTNNFENMLQPKLMDSLLNRFDLFVIWQALLLIFGFSKVANLKLQKSAIVVGIMWLIATAFTVVPILLTRV